METKIDTWENFYDINQYIQNEISYWIENKREFLIDILFNEDRDALSVTDKEIETHFYEDYFIAELHWDDFKYNLLSEFKKYIGKTIYVKGSNIGWRNLEGEKTFQLKDGEDIFTEIAPRNCDLSFYISKIKEKEYKITIYHHDSPMGEHYNLTIQ